jgi:hypothetical protein
MTRKIKVRIRTKTAEKPKDELPEALLDTWLDDDEDLEKEAKETKPGAAPDGKCDPERGDFACYMGSEGKQRKTPTKPVPTKPLKTLASPEKRGKTDG